MESTAVALATFFATIGPLDVAAVFAALTATATAAHKRSMAIRGVLIGGAILFTFALAGEILLASFGISLAALRTAGGVLLLLIGIDMVNARSTGGTSATGEERQEAVSRADISVVPLATPLIAGPGAMGAAILLMTNASGDLAKQAAVLGSLSAILLLTFVLLMLAARIQALLGVTGMHVIGRVFGVLLCALAVQFIFDGIKQSGLVGS
ncbi:MAG: MarC family protein [Burkholderiales bacterium]